MLEVLILSSESIRKQPSAQSGTLFKCSSVTRHHFSGRFGGLSNILEIKLFFLEEVGADSVIQGEDHYRESNRKFQVLKNI